MRRNYALIVTCTVLCNIAASKSWHGHNSHDPGCYHHNNGWHFGHGSSSPSSSEEYDWYDHSQQFANKLNPWDWDVNEDPHSSYDWAANSDHKHWTNLQRSTTTSTSSPLHSQETVFPNWPTPFPNNPTVYLNQSPPSSREPTVFSNQPTFFSSEPTVFPNQPTSSPNEPTINQNQPTSVPSETTIFPNQPSASPNEPTINQNQPTSFPSELTIFPNQPSASPTINSNQQTFFPSEPTLFPNQPSASPNAPTINSNQQISFSSEPTVVLNQATASPNAPTINPNQPATFPSEPTVFPNQPLASPNTPTINANQPTPSPNDNPLADPSLTSSIRNPSEPSTGTLLTDVDTCLRSCPVTPEYDPVCGTNYETYTNMGRFLCAQRCGVDVKIFLKRRCPALGVGQLRATKVQCIATCSITEEYNPVCGSDGITYDNPSTLFCAQMCGYNVILKSMTSCSEVTTIQSPNLRVTTSLPYGIRSCIESCTSDTEFKPVCGTNDITYSSPSHLDCARICGIDVEIKHGSPCGQVNNNDNKNPSIPSVNDQRVNPLPPTVQMCVNSCPVTDNYRPVCGTNGITYTNPSQLECDQLCGIRVEILQLLPCTQIINNNQISTTTTPTTSTTLSPMLLASCIRACPQTPEYNPVCGTNGVTYKNPSHLSCAQICGTSVDIKRRSACPPAVVTEPPTDDQPSVPITNAPLQTTKEPIVINGDSDNINEVTDAPVKVPDLDNGNKPSDNKDLTTISPAVLSIFTDPNTTTTEGDEAIDFDSRFGEDKRSKK